MSGRTTVVFALALLGLTACSPPPPPALDIASVFDGSAGRWVDLSYAYGENTVYWPTAEAFALEEVAYGMTEAGYFYSAYNFSTAEHGGTHLDSPIHFSQGGNAAHEIPLGQLIGPASVVDVSDHVTADYLVTVEDLQGWEARHGRIPTGAILLIRTGWGSRWPDAEAYLGTAARGAEAVPDLHFPGLAPEAARWLVDEREISAIGIDTASIDYGQSSLYETHQVLYGQNIPGFENVAAMGELPEWGSFIVALPMKIEGGSGAPLRIVAFIPNG